MPHEKTQKKTLRTLKDLLHTSDGKWNANPELFAEEEELKQAAQDWIEELEKDMKLIKSKLNRKIEIKASEAELKWLISEAQKEFIKTFFNLGGKEE